MRGSVGGWVGGEEEGGRKGGGGEREEESATACDCSFFVSFLGIAVFPFLRRASADPSSFGVVLLSHLVGLGCLSPSPLGWCCFVGWPFFVSPWGLTILEVLVLGLAVFSLL